MFAINLSTRRLMAILVILVSASASAQSVEVRIAIQPGNYSAIAYKVADELGYWKEAGLSPTYQLFPAGIPQIRAHQTWDFATMGAVPALIGAREFDLVTIAVANDESQTNVLMAKKAFADKVRQTRRIPDGTRIAVTLNSTADYAAQTCLALWGGKLKNQMNYEGMPQDKIMAAGAEGRAELLALWAPNSYFMEDTHQYETLCSGKDFSPGVFGVTVVNRQWGESNPDRVSSVLAVLLRAKRWIKRNPAEAKRIHAEGAAADGVQISASAASKDYELRPVFELADQIELMRGGGADPNASRLARSFFSLNVFLNEGKLQSRIFRASSFVDASYLQRIKNSPDQIAFINKDAEP